MAPYLSEHRSDGPDAPQVLNQAFDADFYGEDPAVVQNARNELADALLRAADQDGCSDVEALSKTALTMMALSYRRRTA